SGKVEEIARRMEPRQIIDVTVKGEPDSAVRIAESLPAVDSVCISQKHGANGAGNGIEIRYNGAPEEEHEVLTALVQAGIKVRGFVVRQTDLEELFMNATGEVVS
ncbi:MAG TPA: DUF4162 domain-containing protein, partial [Chthonomonadales bacterium]|nr:DUF4162 domain-containing protein [Chthonomonadales bacterium]